MESDSSEEENEVTPDQWEDAVQKVYCKLMQDFCVVRSSSYGSFVIWGSGVIPALSVHSFNINAQIVLITNRTLNPAQIIQNLVGG